MYKFTVVKTLALSVAVLTLAACSAPAGKTNTAAVTPVASTVGSTVISSGTFSGRSDHVTTGGVSIVKTSSGYQIVLAGDFSLDGAPDPVVALGNNETYVVANKIASLSNKTGAQTYALPASFTPGKLTQAYIWCEKFSVPLGVATLSTSN